MKKTKEKQINFKLRQEQLASAYWENIGDLTTAEWKEILEKEEKKFPGQKFDLGAVKEYKEYFTESLKVHNNSAHNITSNIEEWKQEQPADVVFSFYGEKKVRFCLKDGKLDVEVFGDMTENAKLFIQKIKELTERDK